MIEKLPPAHRPTTNAPAAAPTTPGQAHCGRPENGGDSTKLGGEPQKPLLLGYHPDRPAVLVEQPGFHGIVKGPSENVPVRASGDRLKELEQELDDLMPRTVFHLRDSAGQPVMNASWLRSLRAMTRLPALRREFTAAGATAFEASTISRNYLIACENARRGFGQAPASARAFFDEQVGYRRRVQTLLSEVAPGNRWMAPSLY